MHDLTTEDDLRSALLSLAPDTLDASDFRARLDSLIADGAAPAHPAPAQTDADADGQMGSDPQPEHDEPDATVLSLTAPPASRRSRRTRLAFAATIAACAAAVVAIAVAVLPGTEHGSGRHITPATHSEIPAQFRGLALPGTVVLATYTGTGSRTVAFPARTLPRYFEYDAFASCSGGGSLLVDGAGTTKDECARTTVFGRGYTDRSTAATAARPLVISASATTTWTVVIVMQPSTRSNGSLQSVSSNVVGPDNGLRMTGRGSRRVTFTDNATGTGTGDPATHYAVTLVCRGAGVHLPDLNGAQSAGGAQTTGGLVTHTCFAGHQYSWGVVPLTLPRTLRVLASPGTTWTIVLDPMS